MSGSVVCGVDWSEESIAAAGVAARLSGWLRAPLVLAHVVEEDPVFPYGSKTAMNRSRHQAHEEATRMFERLGHRLGLSGAETRVRYGAPADELAGLGLEEDAALLVVGSRGRGAVKTALFGSVSSGLSRVADRPVVVVPHDGAVPGMEGPPGGSTIVCGVDDSSEARSAARVAAALAEALDNELLLVHAYSPAASTAAIPSAAVAPPVDHEALEKRERHGGEALLRRIVDEDVTGVHVRTRLEAGAPASALERCARSERAPLIVVGTHGRGPVASALVGSTSVALAAGGPVPVVLVPEGAALRAPDSGATLT